MKKLLLATALLSSPAMADDFCLTMHSVGEVVMNNRQIGVPLPNMMKIVNESSDELRKPLKEITLEAYSQPVYNTKKMQEKVTAEFANNLYVECLKRT